MSGLFKNDFFKVHAFFVAFYLLTFGIGLLRGFNTFFIEAHPILGVTTLGAPLIVYLLSKNKRVVHQIFKYNLVIEGSGALKAAKISSLVIMVYFIFSVITGALLYFGLYTSETYAIFQMIHSISKVLVPLAVITHISSHLIMKKKS